MKRSVLLAYQWITGLSDTATGALLYLAPLLVLRLMGLHPPADAAPYIAYIGAFVFSVGLACLYGVFSLIRREDPARIETVWLLTALARAAVAIYLAQAIFTGQLEAPWISVVLFDGTCALFQAIGLHKGWLLHD